MVGVPEQILRRVREGVLRVRAAGVAHIYRWRLYSAKSVVMADTLRAGSHVVRLRGERSTKVANQSSITGTLHGRSHAAQSPFLLLHNAFVAHIPRQSCDANARSGRIDAGFCREYCDLAPTVVLLTDTEAVEWAHSTNFARAGRFIMRDAAQAQLVHQLRNGPVKRLILGSGAWQTARRFTQRRAA